MVKRMAEIAKAVEEWLGDSIKLEKITIQTKIKA